MGRPKNIEIDFMGNIEEISSPELEGMDIIDSPSTKFQLADCEKGKGRRGHGKRESIVQVFSAGNLEEFQNHIDEYENQRKLTLSDTAQSGTRQNLGKHMLVLG
jgi:hypothetical protein